MVGFDPVRGRSVQRSFTVRGDEECAQARRQELVADVGISRVDVTAGGRMTVGDLLERFLAAPHHWSPGTLNSHRYVVEKLVADRVARRRLVVLTPGFMRATIRRWQQEDLSVPTVSARWLVLRSAVSWAVEEELLRTHPLMGMRGPPRPVPRRHHGVAEVRQLLRTAEAQVAAAEDAVRARPDRRGPVRALFVAEQTLLLARLTADSGARRGELDGLRRGSLDGRILTIESSVSSGVLGPTKSKRTRRLTLGRTTTEMITRHCETWAARTGAPSGDWIFAASPDRRTRITTSGLTQRLHRLGVAAGVEGSSLHRLRHSVATYLVGNGKLLKAQARLGHRDPATTLRHYSHATPLDDQDIADDLDTLLNGT
ncbi:tyrosine-type recombinase/integrase [Frankia sp. AgPm24]|uniref:tyrosine-type recombinase/integrase n=1 Tax=Frankia sp. AgPm24 TaxID=631128 RepID=UPI00200CD9E7|nr:tyrosine-type recombinase/integrase [Frankia sp. AgPm24]MCK9921745.1 tyrosine-type recombinase/integrase [Frankia sp. AgPm24]